jgi:hypothetical protein
VVPLVRGGTNYKGQVRRTTVRLQHLHVHRVSVETELHRLILCLFVYYYESMKRSEAVLSDKQFTDGFVYYESMKRKLI